MLNSSHSRVEGLDCCFRLDMVLFRALGASSSSLN